MDMELTVHEFVEVLVRISFWRANPTFGLAKRKVVQLVPLPDCLDEMLRRVVLPTAKKDDTAAFRKELAASGEMLAALAEFEPKLRAWFGHHASSMMGAHMGARLQYKQWLDLLVQGYGAKPGVLGFTPGNEIGEWSLKQDSEITGDERCRNQFHVQFSMPMAKFAFINAQALDQLSVGQARDTDQMTTLSFSEFKECVARAGVEKYKPIEQMAPWVVRHAHAPLLSHSPPCHPSPLHPPPPPLARVLLPAGLTVGLTHAPDCTQAIRAFCRNLLGEANTEECVNEATLIRAERYDWTRLSQPLPSQPLREHRKWLEVWQRLELSDVYYFPLWEKGVHDTLQTHFKELSLIFLAYCRSLLGSNTAEDAMEMEMSEFKDFVDECQLETKFVNFDRMCNMFIKANATNSAQVRDAHHESRRSAGTKMDGRTTAVVGLVKGASDGGEAVKDQELVLYEFVGMLVRIAFQRANPTFGSYGKTRKEIDQLPGCLIRMLEDEVFPRARKDESALFRETVMAELSVRQVLDAFKPRLKAWYLDKATGPGRTATSNNAMLELEQLLRLCEADEGKSASMGITGTWECRRESGFTADPRCRTRYRWSLSMAQVKMAFAHSQPSASLGAGKSSGADAMALLDFDEFLECCARLGVDKYRGVRDMAPADAVRGLCLNLLGDKSPDEVVVEATYIPAERYNAQAEARSLKGDSPFELRRWLSCWEKMELMDLYMWPLWEKEVHGILQPLFKELQLIFLAYTRSISEDSAEDAMEMSLDEFHDFVVDVGLETKQYRFDVMSNQFIKVRTSGRTRAATSPRRLSPRAARGLRHAQSPIPTARRRPTRPTSPW